jgi:beta-1,4-N-acetylglucosaminyltransferase
MIFVTVGTGKFDELIKKVDEVSSEIDDRIIMQIGNGSYTPKSTEYFRFKPNLSSYFKKSKVVISHGGAGTIYELLIRKKKIIGVANTNRTDVHQFEILKALSKQENLIWCRDIKDILGDIKKAGRFKFKLYKKPKCEIADKIKEFLSFS